MQDVEEQRLQQFRVLAHALEVETLEARERNSVFGVIEEKSELAAASPLRESARNVVPERVRQHAQRAERRVDRIEVFDLVKEFTLGGRVELAGSLPLDQHLEKQREKIEIFLRRGQRKRVDLEILGFQAHANIRASEKLRKAFKAPTQVKNERVRIVFLKIGNEEIQQERLPCTRSPKDHRVGHIAIMEVQEVRRVVIGLKDR